MNELQNIYLHAQSLSLDMDDKVLTTLLPSSALQSAFIVGQDKPETSTNCIYFMGSTEIVWKFGSLLMSDML